LYYTDGRVQVYHGYLANLGKKHVSRQRLCLPGVIEFWVNARDGSPYFYVTAEVNEKMIEMLTDEIVPELIKLHPVSDEHKKRMEDDEDEPLFTIVFDREAYSPEFFFMLWTKYRIAIITYRKHVKDQWDENLFETYEVPTTLEDTEMKLLEQNFTTPDGKYTMREVRRLCDDGHQTASVSTNKKLSLVKIASNMFARWAQENFFSYMRQDYALDKIIQYSIDELDGELKVVNPEYNKVDYKIKKAREKLSRRKAKLYEHNQKNPLTEEDEKENRKWLKKNLELVADRSFVEKEIETLVNQRAEISYKIPLEQMPESKRYNQLDQESKKLQNTIKIICYRAETALAGLLSPYYKRADQEIRTLIKSIINASVDMEVDSENTELRITLYPLSNLRSNEAVSKICEKINETHTIYPGTNLRIIYNIATI
jgi:hypothetical protein